MQKETCGIYVISERATQRAIYVGQSIGIEGRWPAYKNRFPKERFDYRIIQECLPAELNFWEKYYIRALKTHWSEAGENQNWGGQYWPRPEEPLSPATRAKIAAVMKGRPGRVQSEEEKAKRRGRVQSEEEKAKRRGRVQSEEEKAKRSATLKGRVKGPMSEEQKAKQSAAQKGRVQSEEERAKRSEAMKAAMKDRVQSEEERAKRSEAMKAAMKDRVMTEEERAKRSEALKAVAALKRAAKAAAVAALEALLIPEIASE